MRAILSALILMMLFEPANATGSLACTVADKSLELSLEGAFSSGTGAALVNAGGNLSVRLAGAPIQLPRWSCRARTSRSSGWMDRFSRSGFGGRSVPISRPTS